MNARLIIGVLILTGLVHRLAVPSVVTAAAQDDKPNPSVAKPAPDSLDSQLLDGLDTNPRGTAGSAAPGDAPSPRPPSDSDLDRQLMQQLGEGEDIGQEQSNPLVAISQRMRIAKELIDQQVTSEQTQRLQSRIVEDLEKLIEQLQKQCQSSQGNNTSGGTPKPGGKAGKPTRGGSGEVQGTPAAAKESAERMGKKPADKAELERVQAMLKQIWGHLPPQLQQQIQSATIEEFLPKYEGLIEDYFRRLAGENER